MCCGDKNEEKELNAQLSELDEAESESNLSRRSLLKTVSAGAIALGIAAGASSEAQAHNVRGCPEISRLSWDLGPLQQYEWKCEPCKCNQQENFVASWRFRTPIKLSTCDEKIIPDNSILLASLRVVWTYNNCQDGAGAVIKKVVGRYEGFFDIFHPTAGVKLAHGEMMGTWGFDTELDATPENRCCAFPHDEGCLRGTLGKFVAIPGTNRVRRVPCVFHATLTSRSDIRDDQFCELGPKGWIARVNGTIECRCLEIAINPNAELQVNQWQATPNPLESAAPITFLAQGQGVNEIQIVVTSLAGLKVFESEQIKGNSLIWNGVDNHGKTLTNGVYLYKITARGYDGKTVQSQLQKLIVKR